jgi:hypothetical protein
MILLLKRGAWTDKATHGQLFIDGELFCDTLEDKDRFLEDHNETIKVYGQTAIPRGEYKVEVNWSNRFTNYMPMVLDVPYFKGIRIHPGNTDKDTEGCILVGLFYSIGTIASSRVTYQRLMRELEGKKDIKIIIE